MAMDRGGLMIVVLVVLGCNGTPATVSSTTSATTAKPTMTAPSATASAACASGTAVPDPEGLGFLEKVSARLEIELTESPVPAAPNLMNQKAPRSAKLKSVALPSQIYENGAFRKMTAAEAEMVVFRGAELTLRGLGKPVKHTAPNCK